MSSSSLLVSLHPSVLALHQTLAASTSAMQFKNIFLAAVAAALSTAQEIPTLEAALNSTESLSALNTLLGGYPECMSSCALCYIAHC
jgi:hypothetical protein